MLWFSPRDSESDEEGNRQGLRLDLLVAM